MADTEKSWAQLLPLERENYILFHETAYKDDISHAEHNAVKFPRWSIISAYYAMHDVTKLFLAKKFAIKLESPGIHEKAIMALGEIIKEKETKTKLLNLLKGAKEIYFNSERLKERVLPELLRHGKAERGKTQYYREDYSKERQANMQKASYFLDTFAKPYIKLVEGLLK